MTRTVSVLILATCLLGPSHTFFWSRLFGSDVSSSDKGVTRSTKLSGSLSPASPGSRSGKLIPSWDSRPKADSLTWREAQQWCEDRGMRAVSVDTEAKAQEVLGLLSKSGIDYFWTSGIKENPLRKSDGFVRWGNGASGRITPGSYPWSEFGFGFEKEDCIAALNIFFYPDGARLHDIGCEHTKPVLCER